VHSLDDAVRLAAAKQASGEARRDEAELSDAEAICEAVLGFDPANVGALNVLGLARLARNRNEDARALFERACAAAPGDGVSRANRGHALLRFGAFDEALANFARAAELGHADAPCATGRGVALVYLGRHAEAEAAFRAAIALAPQDASAHFNLACVLLRRGDFAHGWPEYEWRWGMQGMVREPGAQHYPLWLGRESLAGKRIFVVLEQGLGDAIQFSRYLPMLRERGAEVFLLPRPGLRALMQASFPEVHHIANGDMLPPIDFHVPAMSLPLAFGTTLETIPARVPYLRVPEAARARWSGTVPRDRTLQVGLVWRGGAVHPLNAVRSLRLPEFAPLMQAPGCRFWSLQQGVGEAERRWAEGCPGLALLGDRFGSMADTAAVVEQLDLVLAVDTSVAHLAGALGRPTWLLLPANGEWRWLDGRADSPWYPGMTIFRQPAPGDWGTAIGSVIESLGRLRQC